MVLGAVIFFILLRPSATPQSIPCYIILATVLIYGHWHLIEICLELSQIFDGLLHNTGVGKTQNTFAFHPVNSPSVTYVGFQRARPIDITLTVEVVLVFAHYII